MTADNPQNDSLHLTLRCRLIPDFNICTAISAIVAFLSVCFAIGIAITESLKAGGAVSFALMIDLMSATPLYWLLARSRGAIILSEGSVRWRTAFSGWKSATWSQVERAETQFTSSTIRKFVVSTNKGQFSWTKCFENAEQVAPFAARFCPRIEPQFEMWPQRFDFYGPQNWLFIPMLPLVFVWAIWPLWSFFSAPLKDWLAQISLYSSLYGPLLTLLSLIIFIFVTIGFPGLFLLAFGFMWAQSFFRRREVFWVDAQGLTWHRPQKPALFVEWAELRILHTESRGWLVKLPFYRLEAQHGEMNWNSGLHGATKFHQALRDHAPQLQENNAPHLSDSLSEAPFVDSETMVFEFKTRTLRAMLFLEGIVSAAFLGLTIWGPIPPRQGDPPPKWFIALGFLLMSAITTYGIAVYKCGALRLDSRGIERKTPFKRRFVPWESIDALAGGYTHAFLRVGKNKIFLNSSIFVPAYWDTLLKEIERRTNLNFEHENR